MAGELVLVVEDNAMNMELVLDLLEQTGYRTLQATTAEVGIVLARTELPQLILMDVSLPGMDGLTAVRTLKKDSATRAIPIIVLTANAMQGDEAKAMLSGCDGYLAKPINTREFIKVVAQFIRAGMPD